MASLTAKCFQCRREVKIRAPRSPKSRFTPPNFCARCGKALGIHITWNEGVPSLVQAIGVGGGNLTHVVYCGGPGEGGDFPYELWENARKILASKGLPIASSDIGRFLNTAQGRCEAERYTALPQPSPN